MVASIGKEVRRHAQSPDRNHLRMVLNPSVTAQFDEASLSKLDGRGELVAQAIRCDCAYVPAWDADDAQFFRRPPKDKLQRVLGLLVLAPNAEPWALINKHLDVRSVIERGSLPRPPTLRRSFLCLCPPGEPSSTAARTVSLCRGRSRLRCMLPLGPTPAAGAAGWAQRAKRSWSFSWPMERTRL